MADRADIRPEMRAQRRPRPVDAAISALAAGQHGVVARRQLVALGLGRRAIGHRLESGRLHRVHRGVYAVGHPLVSRRGIWLAAVLALDGAVLSHRAAAALWGIRDSDLVEVTVGRDVRRRAGIRIHEAALAADEVTVHDRIPVTTPARTLLDLATVLRPHELERAANEAELRRLGSPTSLEALAARYPGRPGTPAIRRLLDSRSGIARPRTNRHVALADGTLIEADCYWPGARLMVELDGAATHHTREAFERDRARDRRAVASGYRVVRITWRQLHGDRRTLAAQLRTLLVPGEPEQHGLRRTTRPATPPGGA